jgi:hypothetical protein
MPWFAVKLVRVSIAFKKKKLDEIAHAGREIAKFFFLKAIARNAG